MKLSIITPSIMDWKELEYISDVLRNQNNQDFEVIFVVSKANKKMYSVIESVVEFFGSRVKVVFNQKRKSIQSDIITALHLVKNQYVYVLSPDSVIKKNFVRILTNKLIDNQPQILEFRPNLTGSIKWHPQPRINTNTLINKKESQEFVAYAFPFIFNKVFKKSFIEQFINYRVKEMNDTKFATELLYVLLVNASSYMYWNVSPVKEHISSSTWLAPNNFLTQFKIIENFITTNNLDLLSEITYAKLYFLQIVLLGFLNSREFSVFKVLHYIFDSRKKYNEKRGEKFLNDLYTFLKDYHEENFQIFLANNYVNKINKEAEYLRNLPDLETAVQIYKNL
ncbi:MULTISPECIES: glycosyltransferase [unclassified Mycoplasma]|uniref:glycosyltransferase n=1 Tax=unclassified Mycoplasma TaxID=2683645 RepID=UPI00216AB610|nr:MULTISPECIES: glycosyltransferase [unclassified Mycoplasma]MCS4537085.1 glycosyltransferase [Mycoplasma sp. CSL7475-4]MCT4469773.1 glycosyltransferase [Mycoplasma sp. HS2188]